MELHPQAPLPILKLCFPLYEFFMCSAHSTTIRAVQSCGSPSRLFLVPCPQHADCCDEALGISFCCCTLLAQLRQCCLLQSWEDSVLYSHPCVFHFIFPCLYLPSSNFCLVSRFQSTLSCFLLWHELGLKPLSCVHISTRLNPGHSETLLPGSHSLLSMVLKTSWLCQFVLSAELSPSPACESFLTPPPE